MRGDHIGEAQLAKLLEESRQRPGIMTDAAGVHPHFAVCGDCREQFQALWSLEGQLKGMRAAESEPRQSNCPSEQVWREIAGGLTPPGWTLTCIEHASRCHHCGPLLRGAVAELSDLNGEVTEAERNKIAILGSARAEWQEKLARRITGTAKAALDQEAAKWRWFWPPRLATMGVSLLAVVAFVAVGAWVLVQRKQPAAADQLLARAYTEKRTLELRIAGASYAPLRVSLGPAASFTSRPAALLKAEALIASQLGAHPSDPAWLRAKAQADVLEGKYDAAVESLRRALELQPHSSELLIDLGTAYFQRAQQEDRKEDFGAAYEYLSQALQTRPDDPVALFNRAIVAEHQFLYHQALDDWEHYLRVDPGSQWTEEARNRADAVREKLRPHESKATPLLSPAQLVATGNAASRTSEIDEHIDEYLHEAVRAWLPQAFPEGKTTGDPNASRALFFLADLTNRQHGDRWLADLLQGSSGAGFSKAASALAVAVDANATGRFDVSHQQAGLAARLFRNSGNTAGRLRAEFELSFADQIMRRSEDCRRHSVAAEAESLRYPYPWVQIQLGLEESVCSILMSDLGTNQEAARVAENRALKAGYGALHLRALYLVAEGKLVAGDRPEGWKQTAVGLDHYWSGQFPELRGYNFYTAIAYDAEVGGQPNLELANWREAVSLVDSNEELLLRAIAHSSMAKAANAAHHTEVAKYQYGEAVRLFGLAPQTEATRADRLDSEIRTAQLEAGQSAFDAALGRLTRVQDEVRQLSNNFLAQRFYSSLGEVELRSHRAPEAEQAFRSAMRLAEQSLASLISESERIKWSKDAAPVYLGLAEAELLQGRDQESLAMFEWYLGAPQRSRVRGTRSSHTSAFPEPSELAIRLPLISNRTVLAFGVLPDGLAIWVYDNRGVSAKWIPGSSQDLQDQATSFFALCAEPGSDLNMLRRQGTELYSHLIAPVEGHLDPRRTLVIETESFLARLPFEVLQDASGHYLLERAPIVHSSGPYTEARMHPDVAITPDLPALVVGSAASSSEAGLFAIPDVPSGTDTVAGGFQSPRVLKGPEATLSAVSDALPAAAVFHFAGHAATISTRTGLMLEGGKAGASAALLDAATLRALNLREMQLALLAACDTDSGEAGSRGFDSMAEALQTSGVPHVIASRWTVDSIEAKAFADDFYRLLLSGQTVSRATRLTSQKMLASPGTAHPYYWAAFAAYGRP